jgi:ribosomal protein S18 acetylase RimI-like enzyme
MIDPEIRFLPIDLEAHADLCIQFRVDTYVCSFGDAERFWQEGGENGERYLEFLRQRLAVFPQGCVHAWRGDEIIGQLEMRPPDEKRPGYVNLFYLVPQARGTEAGQALQTYVEETFRGLGVERLQLSVSPTNGRALSYYKKHGWIDLGPRHDFEWLHLMELTLKPGG